MPKGWPWNVNERNITRREAEGLRTRHCKVGFCVECCMIVSVPEAHPREDISPI